MKNKASDITVKKLENSELLDLLPEFYELKDITENDNFWHRQDPVFNHSINFLKALEVLIDSSKKEILDYLDQKIVNYTKKEILFLGGVFHDIAKKETIKKHDGIMNCPGHHETGYFKTKKILERFNLSEEERERVALLVKNHMALHLMVYPKNNELKKEYIKFAENFSDIFLELIFLAASDNLGSQLKEIHPDEFDFRINFYKKALQEY
jgi:UTP:GlnB (protein PII) uridylyltransferase